MYNSGTDKADYSKDTAIKILWLVFWVIQQVWLVGFSSVMGQAMFPKCAPARLSLSAYLLCAMP